MVIENHYYYYVRSGLLFFRFHSFVSFRLDCDDVILMTFQNRRRLFRRHRVTILKYRQYQRSVCRKCNATLEAVTFRCHNHDLSNQFNDAFCYVN